MGGASKYFLNERKKKYSFYRSPFAEEFLSFFLPFNCPILIKLFIKANLNFFAVTPFRNTWRATRKRCVTKAREQPQSFAYLSNPSWEPAAYFAWNRQTINLTYLNILVSSWCLRLLARLVICTAFVDRNLSPQLAATCHERIRKYAEIREFHYIRTIELTVFLRWSVYKERCNQDSCGFLVITGLLTVTQQVENVEWFRWKWINSSSSITVCL